MTLRKILVPLAGTADADSALVTAFDSARLWQAHVSVLHARADSRDMALLVGEGLSGAMIEEMMAAAEKDSGAHAVALHALFDRLAEAHGVPRRVWSRTEPALSAHFASVTGRVDEVVARESRLADLTVVAHLESDEDGGASDALHAALFDSGRPLLVAPRRTPGRIGRRICIGWNGTAESAAAVAAALPWLRQAEAVCILSAEAYQRPGPAAPELADYLAMHGVEAQCVTFKPQDRGVGHALLAAAQAFGADMLAMGAYSHSRLRQMILGGVTRHVLEHAEIPVLMKR